jgi:hypothetical protein
VLQSGMLKTANGLAIQNQFALLLQCQLTWSALLVLQSGTWNGASGLATNQLLTQLSHQPLTQPSHQWVDLATHFQLLLN